MISIGNITVGGTGKTPATIAVAEEAQKRGFRPVILTRGYKGKAKGPCFVTARDSRAPAEQFGDEPVLMAERLKGVPVVKCADRYNGGLFALNSIPPDARAPFVFILDDGFQHWKLHRDVDIVLVDGLNPFGNRRMLPLGPLRGPIEELKRADAFVVTKSRNKAAAAELRGINPDVPVFFSGYGGLRINDGAGNEFPAERLRYRKAYAFCGIANPASFKQTVATLPSELSGLKAYGDHHRYTESDILSLEKKREAERADFLITTEKDMVKLRELKIPAHLLCLRVGFKVEAAFFDYIFQLLFR